MQDVELRLVANNAPAVKSVKQLATESEKLYTNSEKQQKRQVGLIADIEKELGRLQTAQKNAMSVENITKYNQKIAEAKTALQEYNEVGTKTEKQGTSMIQSIGKWALGLGVVTTAVGLLKKAFQETQQGMVLFNQVSAATSKVLSNIVNGVSDWNQGVVEAIILAKELALAKLEEKRDSIATNKLMREYNQLYNEGVDATKGHEERLRDLTAAKQKYIEATKKEIEDNQRLLDIILKQWQNDPNNLGLESQAIDQANKVLALQSQMEQGTRRLTRQITSFQAEAIKQQEDAMNKIHKIGKDLQEAFLKDEEDTVKESNEKKKKLLQDYYTAADALIDKYNASGIDSKTGVAKLIAQKEFALNEINNLKTHLVNALQDAGLGDLTDSQNKMIETLRDNVQQAFLKGMEKEAKPTKEQKTAISKALLAGIPTGDEIQKYSGNTTKGTHPVSSIWELIGIDPETEDGKKEIEAINKVVSTTVTALKDVYDARVEAATKTRELADQRVSEAETELNTEVELYKAGYASNVAAKKQELADLKKERDKAQKDEEEATRKQKLIDSISQGASIATSVANLLKQFTKIPYVGIALAAVAIGTLFTLWASSKTKAAAASLAEGGYGEVSGRRHSQGGERFLDHVEVEQGEKWGVLSRSASRKYGNTFYKMVDSFNRDALSIPKQGVINNILLDTSMTNERLDTLINLNKRERKEEIIIMNGRTIYKKGSTTRIIKH